MRGERSVTEVIWVRDERYEEVIGTGWRGGKKGLGFVGLVLKGEVPAAIDSAHIWHANDRPIRIAVEV